jgi:gamma-glutamyltranspeptidase
VAIQGVIDVLDFGMAPAQAVLMPALRKNWPLDEPLRMPVGDKGFPDSTLRGLTERGFAIEALSGSEGLSLAGYWVAVAIDPATRRIVSGITPGFNGAAEGY